VNAPNDLFDALFAGLDVRVTVRSGRTGARPMHVDLERWSAAVDETDLLAVARCEGPVLDIGCGPGRIVSALAERGVAALGVDVSEVAVGLTSRRGASVLRRDVADRVPGEGRWGTAVLMDGNIGIGGDPGRLLGRCAELVMPGGLVVVEVDAADPCADERSELELIDSLGRRTVMPWAHVGAAACTTLGAAHGLVPVEEWTSAHRSFVCLRSAGRTRFEVASLAWTA
jgi:SAM-dependent methyltransferase